MAENVLGRLSGEELLKLLEQLDDNESYFERTENDCQDEISLNVAYNVEVTAVEQQDSGTSKVGHSRLNNEENTDLMYSDQESNDPSYNPDDSIESSSSSDDDDDDRAVELEVDNRVSEVANVNSAENLTVNDVNNNNIEVLSNSVEVIESEIGNTEENGQRRGRKRERRSENWARNVRRRKCSKGERYVNCRGKVVEERKIGGPCNCKNQCYAKLSESCRNRVFKEFWAMGDQNKQNAYLFSMIHKEPVKRRRPKLLNGQKLKTFPTSILS